MCSFKDSFARINVWVFKKKCHVQVTFKPWDSLRGLYKYLLTACHKGIFWTHPFVPIGMFDQRPNGESLQYTGPNPESLTVWSACTLVESANWYRLVHSKYSLMAEHWDLLVSTPLGLTSFGFSKPVHNAFFKTLTLIFPEGVWQVHKIRG